ncbi:unnamed protein product [Adineta steineri]|nr:unnamed protein product [Adineta steineri]CAF1369474.1 unnamed protein product [Adineta steineri]CAF3650833.1 unnamed protein product [Adineta steineri]CAF3809184.1 unnamed protein product [Adineta steineri]
MSQAPNPFTQVASQGYGDFAATLDEDDQEENHVADEEEQQHEDDLEGPQSPEPEEHEINELGFTQTQERSYPTGIESPDEDENEDQVQASDNEQEREDDEEAGPSSPPVEDADADASNEQQEVEEEEENNDDDDDDVDNTSEKESPVRRRVQIMNDSDNDDDEQQAESTSVVSKDKNRSFLKQMTMKNEDSHKKHKKRRSDEHRHHHEKKSKRFRKNSDAGEEEEDNDKTEEQQDKNTDNVEATSDVEDVVDDIFGKDVNENEEEADDQEEVADELADLNDEAAQHNAEEEEEEDVEQQQQQQTFDAEEDEEDDEDTSVRKEKHSSSKNNIAYDIDLYLEKKAERRRGNRRRGKNGDVDLAGPDSDQFVSKLIDQMKIATEEDRIFNKSRQPATAKLLLLPVVEQHLCRADLSDIFLDNGILTVFKDWLSPLPDKSLPNIKIRESLIRILQQFGVINAEPLRDSSIGKALMYLYKHPRETKENKLKLIKIIHDWARPIFNLDTDYKLLTREERQQRDANQASLKRQTSSTGKPKNRASDMDLPFDNKRRQHDGDELNEDEECPRARVPRPSNKDYVVRPVSTVEYSDKKGDGKKKSVSRLDELKRRQQDRKRLSKPMSIVKLSIEGNKMHL